MEYLKRDEIYWNAKFQSRILLKMDYASITECGILRGILDAWLRLWDLLYTCEMYMNNGFGSSLGESLQL